MKDTTGMKKQFIVLSQAWYGKASIDSRTDGLQDDICFGSYDPSGGTIGEMLITWYFVGDKLVPKLEAFDDAWFVLSTFPDVINELALLDNTNPSPRIIANVLLKCGFEDVTPRVNPYNEKG